MCYVQCVHACMRKFVVAAVILDYGCDDDDDDHNNNDDDNVGL